MTSGRSLYLMSCVQACWRGYRQRRAYLERLYYLKSNTEAAIKVWKIFSSAFVPMLGIVACLFSLQGWHLAQCRGARGDCGSWIRALCEWTGEKKIIV